MRALAVSIILFVSLPLGVSLADDGVIAIVGGTVHTVSGPVIENGMVVIRNGKISSIGKSTDVPDGARQINATGKIITPGLIASFTQIGLDELSLDDEGNDSWPDDNVPFGAAIRAADAINPDTALIPVTRRGGVTMAISAPHSGPYLFGGTAALLHMGSGDNIIIDDSAAMVSVLGEAGARKSGGTRAAAWATFRNALDEARDYDQNRAAYASGRERDHTVPLADLKALGLLVNGELPLMILAHRASELRQIAALKQDYDLNVILIGAAEAWRVADELAKAQIPVILTGFENLPMGFESMGATLKNAARLHDAGVAFTFMGEGPAASHNARLLRHFAGNAVAHGLPWDAALEAITLTPARVWGMEGSAGTIDVGKRADLVIWSGDPLELTTHAETVFVGGVQQSLETRATKLRDRYLNTNQQDPPFAYRGGPKD